VAHRRPCFASSSERQPDADGGAACLMKQSTFFGFVSPSLIVMLVLMVFPLATAIWLGFHYITFRNLNAPVFVGLQNYTDLLNDPEFWDALRFTAIYTLFIVPATIVIGMAVALLLDQVKKLRGLYIAGALLPFIVTPVVGTLMFRTAFERNGLYTYLLSLIGLDINFFLNAANVQALIIFHGIWYSTPFAMIVLFAGLQTLPQDPLEAASIDGANWVQRLRYVIIPHLRSLFVFIALIGVMDAYRVFDSIFVLTKQNPIYNAETLMVFNYQVALSYQQLGRANAMSVLTVIGIFIILVPFLYLTYKQQTEER
jgi:ABC-type sugar transport system permease subunit